MPDLLPERVTLQQGRRMRGGLLASAEPLPDGWEHGVTFRTFECSEPEIIGPCEVADTTADRPGDTPVFTPVFIRQTAACALMSQIGTTDMAMNRLESTTEWAMGRVLATGLGSVNPSFADAETIHVGTEPNSPAEAILAVSCLEGAAAAYGFGAEVVLHAPIQAAAWLRSSLLIDDEGLSPAGFPWILSAGYPGPIENNMSIWATGAVWASVEPAYTLTDPTTGNRPVNWRTNLDAAFSQRLGLAAFNPCLNLTASFVVPACNGES